MRLEWVTTTRRPGWPWWAVALSALWLALGAATLLASAHTGRAVRLCLVKHLTGVPCPTCGFTRGAFSLLHGHPIQAWLYNPLLFTFLGLVGLVLLVRLAWGRTPVVHLSARQGKTVWMAAALLFAANWFYVICWVG